MEKNEVFTAEITDLTSEGEGVGKTGGFTWFIKGTVPGDTVTASVMKVKKTYGYARAVEVIKASPDRVDARCPIAGPCGGCQIQGLSYEAQLRFKADKVKAAVTRIGGFSEGTFETEPIIGMEDPWRYRNKAQYPVSRAKDGRIIAGFYAGHTHSVIGCTDCLIGAETDGAILRVITGFMEKYRIEPYDEEMCRGLIRHVLIRTSRAFGEILVCLVINGDSMKCADKLVEAIVSAVPEVSTICLNVNKENTNVILGDTVRCLFGSGYITDTIGGVSFRISPQSFFQVNPVQVEKLYGKALEYAGLTGGETVWDLYCGVGTISLFMARHAGRVFGVEVVPQAIDNAKENAALNGITNAFFTAGKAEEITPLWLKGSAGDAGRPDVVCVDPPRKGCDAACLNAILQAAPQKIVYVSCDPASLARDLKILAEGGYTLKKICPEDMFPHTVHVETVCLLSKLSGAKNHISVKVEMDEMDLTAAESKATYQEIQDWIQEKYGFHVTHLNIAKTKRKCGIIERQNFNLPKSDDSRSPETQKYKEEAIIEAFRHFQMI